YARQFLQMMEKPDVDHIDGLSPAISIDQKTTSRNPRSTVGTVTEIYDYLRLLYARVGRPHCPICGKPIAGQSLDAIVDQVLKLEEGTRFTVNAPVVRDRKGEYRVAVDLVDRGEQLLFSENFACPDHGVSLPELQPRIFSFNAPHGACPRCTGLGSQQEIDPDLLVPDPSLSIDDGALVPWSVGGSSGFYEAVIQAIADRYEIDTSKPWSELTEEEQSRFLNGTDGEKIY